ncbi:alginate export family protein [Cloacibacterium sp.]|uniref:alginate export family protein n=1 Tax=Cloacibacterium sp. TaxID=1913682 RepID=UPI0039E41E16
MYAQTTSFSSKNKIFFEPKFKVLSYDEDYSELADSTLRSNIYTKLKYIPLYKNGYLTFGGEARLRMEIRNHLNYGNPLEDRGPDFQQRSRLWADYHIAKNIRAYIELQSSTSYGLEVQASPLDKDQLEVHQAFIDAIHRFKDNSSLIFRLGRQEIVIAKSRLFDNRNAPNLRHSVDAARLTYTQKDWLVEAFGGLSQSDKIGYFNDGWDKNFTFFTSHLVKKNIINSIGLNAEFLYIHSNRKKAPTPVFYGTRNTFSVRLFGKKGSWDYDVEGVYQLGKGINNTDINAWFIASESNFTFPIKMKPYLGYKLDIGSGDKNPDDNKNNSYDFLWSKGISFASDLSYTNLMSFGPAAGFNITPKIRLDFWAQWLWRNSLKDGLYKMSDTFQRVPSYGNSRFIGFRNLLKIEYQVNSFIMFGTYFNQTYKGSYLKENEYNKNLFYGLFYTNIRF